MDPDAVVDSKETVTITLHSGVPTKTMLVDDRHVVWEEGDVVDINDALYQVRVDEKNPSIAYVDNVVAADEYYAHYSATWIFYYDEGLFMELPVTQYYRPDSFDQWANQAIAYSKTPELHFYNAASVLKLGLKGNGEKVKKVTVAGNDNEIMSGQYLVPWDEFKNLEEFGGLEPDTLAIKRTYVQLYANGELELKDTPQYVYLVVPPQTFAKGFTVSVEDMDGKICYKSTDKSVTTKRSEILEMAEFTFNASEALVVSEVTPGPTSVEYKVKAKPGEVMTAVVTKAMWDRFVEVNGEDMASAIATHIVNNYGYSRTVPESGELVCEDAYIYNFNYYAMNLLPDCDYKILVSYANGQSVGPVTINDFKTSKGSGNAPEIRTEVTSDHNSVSVKVFVSGNVTSLLCMNDQKTIVDELIASGMTYLDIVNLWAGVVRDEGLNDAKSEAGLVYSLSDLPNDTEYTFSFLATTETGAYTMEIVNVKTQNVFGVEGDWTTVTEKAEMVSDLLANFGIEPFYIDSLKVEKCGNHDIFRIVDLNKASNRYVMAYEEPAETQYFYIDARDHNAVTVPYDLNKMIVSQYNLMYCSASYFDEGSVNGSYDPSTGVLAFGDMAMLLNGELAYYYYTGNSSVLYLNGGSAPVARNWYLVGSFNEWMIGDANYLMTETEAYYVYNNLKLETDAELKFNVGDWSINRGGNFAKNAALDLIDGGPNFMVPAGTYDIFMTKDASVVYFMDKGFAPENLYVEMGLSKVHTLEPGSYVLTSGAVAAAYSRGVLLTDGNYYTLVYDGTGSLSNYQVGDVLQVRAQAQRYAGMIQLQSASVALVGRSDIATPTPAVYTAANVNELLGQTVPSYIQYEGKLKHSGNYFNVEIEGTQIIGSVSNPMGDIKALLDANDGATIKVTGYYVGMTGNNVYMNTMATAVEVIKQAEETPEVAPTVATVDKFLQAAEDDTWYQLTGKISNVKSTVYGNFDLVDETGSVYVYGLTATKVASNDKSYATLGLKEGDVVTLVGKRTSYKGSPQVGGPAYYVSHVVGENPGEGGEVTPPAGGSGQYDPQGITWTLGDGAYDISSSPSQTGTVNGVELGNVLKLGKGSAVGSATLHIPAGTKKVGAYIIAWKGKTATNLKFSVGGTEVMSMTPKANDGATGNPPYTITVTDSDWYEMDVPTTGAIDVVVETTDPSQGRVIIIGLKAIK